MPRGRFGLIALAIGVLAVVASLLLHWQDIATFKTPDGDDMLRLVEVHDWLNGQSFYDVSQHRMNQPFGAPMHWSRLVDMPIAALILIFEPLLGYAGAQTLAAVVVPMATLLFAMVCVGFIARRLAGDVAALAAGGLIAGAPPFIAQLQPLRVDHHGWEIALSLAALATLVRRRDARAGVIAGAILAVALQISLEVLPFAATLGVMLGIRWCLDGEDAQGRCLRGYALGLFVAEASLFLLLHAAGDRGAHCDAISPPHLLALAVVAFGTTLGSARLSASRVMRFGVLASTALLAGAAFHAVPPGCGVDAFSSLEPVVRTYWYNQVAEGLPITSVYPSQAIALVGFQIVAITSVGWALRTVQGAERRLWIDYGIVLLGATAVGVLVLRANALACAVAAPPATWTMMRVLTRTQASGRMLVRVFGSTLAILALSPFAVPAAALHFKPADEVAGDDPTKPHGHLPVCLGPGSFAALNALPSSRIFAPLDFGPAILFQTHHAVLASGHHRNHVAMAEEITAMTGSDDVAHRILRAHSLAYVVACPGYAELAHYERDGHDDFAAHLRSGRTPIWLTPMTLPGAGFKLWKVAG